MVTISIYLDTRACKKGNPAPLKMAVRQHGQTAFIPTDIKLLPSQWSKSRMEVVNHPYAKYISVMLAKKKLAMEAAVLHLMETGEAYTLTLQQIRDKINEATDLVAKKRADETKTFLFRFERFANLKDKPSTKAVYLNTARKLRQFDPKIASRSFEEINKDYLQDFEAFCSKTEQKNSRNIHLRNIRAVFNDAIDAKITQEYPFRKYSIRPDKVKKKALRTEQIRYLATCKVEKQQEQYRDIFMLMFFLRGINCGDLLQAKTSDILNGRFDYRRNKVGTLFSVKLEPEALEIIKRYKGQKGYLINPLNRYKSYKDYLHHVNDNLKEIGRKTGRYRKVQSPGMFPKLSTNWARHTWSTVASDLDIPKEVISKALGHGIGLSVTDIYIDFDMKKVDDANRKVMDYVLYGKDYRENKD